MTETLEVIPRQWKVIQHVREKFSCRACEKITQPPAPSHPIARGRAGRHLLAQVLFGKYGMHLPLNRQSSAFAHDGIELDVSTLADWVGASAATLMPLVEAIQSHGFAAERIHADDTPVPVLAKARREPDDCGPMFAATAHSPDPIRRRQCSSTRATVPVRIPTASRKLHGFDAGRRLCRVQ